MVTDLLSRSPVHTVLPSPIGPVTVVAEGDAITAILFDAHRHPLSDERMGVPGDSSVLSTARRQLIEYFAGARTAFDLRLAPLGSPFQHRVWDLLRAIPYGETRSYGQLAVQLGDPGLARAVGAANGRNPISIVVPCHRVIGANGKFVGYGGGVPRKAFLFDLEARVAGGAPLF